MRMPTNWWQTDKILEYLEKKMTNFLARLYLQNVVFRFFHEKPSKSSNNTGEKNQTASYPTCLLSCHIPNFKS